MCVCVRLMCVCDVCVRVCACVCVCNCAGMMASGCMNFAAMSYILDLLMNRNKDPFEEAIRCTHAPTPPPPPTHFRSLARARAHAHAHRYDGLWLYDFSSSHMSYLVYLVSSRSKDPFLCRGQRP